ncbi:response regulator transcription factor [Nocardioides sp. 616]|uniref:response regulator n=1 Tax=Nocardioides sp. 616 TaxID=2268090 RepID=UPI000CE2CC4E|nr:response regulator transcription factor [Nocardioides sp. 616]
MLPITVYLLDDHDIIRSGLRALLEREDDLSVVGEAGTVAEGLPEILRLRPDVAVLDTGLPDGSGVDVARALSTQAPDVRALMLGDRHDDTMVEEAFSAGVGGFVLKKIRGRTLVEGIRSVAAGNSLVDPDIANKMMDRLRRASQTPLEGMDSLSVQEQRVLALIGEGLTNRQIGEQVYLSEKTVKNIVTSILAKLGVQRRTQAAVLASRLRP